MRTVAWLPAFRIAWFFEGGPREGLFDWGAFAETKPKLNILQTNKTEQNKNRLNNTILHFATSVYKMLYIS